MRKNALNSSESGWWRMPGNGYPVQRQPKHRDSGGILSLLRSRSWGYWRDRYGNDRDGSGINSDAVVLAKLIVASKFTEITRMRAMFA
jgi:hypothetical protein